MTPFEKRLAAKFLQEASDRYSNDGCNEYEISNTPESVALMNEVERELDPKDPLVIEFDPAKDTIIATDYMLMRVLAEKLKAEAEEDFKKNYRFKAEDGTKFMTWDDCKAYCETHGLRYKERLILDEVM